jgi:hypothetical protein
LSFLHSTVIISTLSEITDTSAVPLVSTAQVVCTTTDYIDHRLICIQTQTETHEHLNNRPTSSEQTLKRTYKSSKILTIPKMGNEKL